MISWRELHCVEHMFLRPFKCEILGSCGTYTHFYFAPGCWHPNVVRCYLTKRRRSDHAKCLRRTVNIHDGLRCENSLESLGNAARQGAPRSENLLDRSNVPLGFLDYVHHGPQTQWKSHHMRYLFEENLGITSAAQQDNNTR